MFASTLQRRLTLLGTLVLKLYANVIQSPVHYYQIKKKLSCRHVLCRNYYQIKKKLSCRHRGLNPRRMFCAVIFRSLFQPYYLVVIAKFESCIRDQILFHAFCQYDIYYCFSLYSNITQIQC